MFIKKLKNGTKMKINKYKIIFFCIFLLAAFLRLYKLSDLPASLNPDEVALGYTSYSLLTTGADEHGNFLPIVLESFGDWKLPVYSYIGVIPIAVFGLNEAAVRLPSVIAGLIGVLLIFKISNLLFSKIEISLLAAFFYALSPWSIYFSRAAYEVNVATTLCMCGLYLFLHYISNKKENLWILISSYLFFCATLVTQHNYILFTPLFVFSLLITYRKRILNKKPLLISLTAFIIIFIILFETLSQGISNKKSNLNLFNDKNLIYTRVEKLRGDKADKNQFVEHLIHNKYLGISYQIGQNYLNSFSPNYLFDKGGEKLVHNIGDIGFFYLFDVVLIFMGFIAFFWNRDKSLKILLPWLLIAPIPSALTRDAPNATRLFTILPVLILIISYGSYKITQLLLVNRFGKAVFCILIALFLLNTLYFFDIYFIHFNLHRVRFWRYGYREAVYITKRYPDYSVVMRGPENFPYIYFLFYYSYNTRKFQREVNYLPSTSEGFRYVKGFGRFEFVERIDYTKLKSKTVYIDDQIYSKSGLIRLPSGEPILQFTVVN